MAKEVSAQIKLQIPAGKANPAPPVGPSLGQHGVNIMEFCKQFNAKTQKEGDSIIPVIITVYKDRSFTFIMKTPPASDLLKKAAGIIKGSGVPPFSFAKPMKKSRYVTDLIQPFATAGGADREPVSATRVNAPSRLAANDRAVSLADFERLCRRHASVRQARARAVIAPGPANGFSLDMHDDEAIDADFKRQNAG